MGNPNLNAYNIKEFRFQSSTQQELKALFE